MVVIINTFCVQNIVGGDTQFDYKDIIHLLATGNLLFLYFSNIYSIYENTNFFVLSGLL